MSLCQSPGSPIWNKNRENKTFIQAILFQIFGIHFPVYITITRRILRWSLGLLLQFSGLHFAYVVLHFVDEGLEVLKWMC